MLMILGALLIVAFMIGFTYVLTLQRALNKVSPHNRLMEPIMVWLLILPCVNLVWQFFIAFRLSGSLQNEFRERGRDDGSDYGKSLAFTQAVLGILVLFYNLGVNSSRDPSEMTTSFIFSLVIFFLFIRYWVKIASYSAQLDLHHRGKRDWESKFDEPDDDYGSRPRRRGNSSDGIKEGEPGR